MEYNPETYVFRWLSRMGGFPVRIETTTKQNTFYYMVVSIRSSLPLGTTQPPRRNENICAEYSGTLPVKK
jgi:hypothetical protein